MGTQASRARRPRPRRARGTGSAVLLCIVLVGLAPRCAGAAQEYRGVVQRFADTLIEKGTDRYGAVHSPLFAATLDLKTLSIPPAPPKLPEAAHVRDGDRCTDGCNPYLDAQTIRAFRELSRLTGTPKYGEATARYLAYFLKHCPSPSTGLLPWGEHTYWSFTAEQVQRDSHEFLVWLPLWPEMWEIDPPVVERAIRATYSHHVFDKKSGIFDRHASYANASAVLGKRAGMPWIKHAALQAYSLAFLHAHTGDALALERARQMARLYWERRDPKTGLPIGCIGYAEQPGSGGIAQAEGLLAAYQVSGVEEFRDMALAYLRAGAAQFPKDPTAARKLEWELGYGKDGGAFREAQYYLAGLALTGDDSLRPACEFYARSIAESLPPSQYATPEAYGRAILFLTGLAACTGSREHRALAEKLADLAIEKLWDPRSGLFRSMEGYDAYEAQLGVGDLLLGLLALSQADYRVPPLASRPKPEAGKPAAAAARALVVLDSAPRFVAGGAEAVVTLRLRNYGAAQVAGRATLAAPKGWKATLPEQVSVPAGTPHPDDPWLVAPGTASVPLRVFPPASPADAPETLVLALGAAGNAVRLPFSLAAVAPDDIVALPFKPDRETLLLVHFDRGPEPEVAAPGVTWHPEGIEIAPGDRQRHASFTKEDARARILFDKGIPKAGTLEMLVRPRWSSVAGPAPASDGVLRHTFWWAPLAGEGLLTCYYLDELDYFGARCVRPGAKEAIALPLEARAGEWHHVAFCWETPAEGGLRGSLFVDGMPTSSGTGVWPPPMAFLQEITVGGMAGVSTWPNADITEVRLSSVPRYRRSFLVRVPQAGGKP